MSPEMKILKLAAKISKLGAAAGLILFTSLTIRCFTHLAQPGRTAQDKAEAVVTILLTAISVTVAVVPEGLLMALPLALVMAIRRMSKQNLLVRNAASCHTAGALSVICTDKAGILTTGRFSVVAGAIGVKFKFAENMGENKHLINATDTDFARDSLDINECLNEDVRALLNDTFGFNSYAYEDEDPITRETVFTGDKSEAALLEFAKQAGWEHYKAVRTRGQANKIAEYSFSRGRMSMASVVKIGTSYRAYFMGNAEALTNRVVNHIVVSENGTNQNGVQVEHFDQAAQANVKDTIDLYLSQYLRTMAFCYRDFESWPPLSLVDGNMPYEALMDNLTLIAIMALEDPLRENVTHAVSLCHGAGIAIKMCTLDNANTAKTIATRCGLRTEGGLLMEGPIFRSLTPAERREIVPNLQILARCTTADKRMLVEALQEQGAVVGVTGDAGSDVAALQLADVGFSKGIDGTETSKEAADIILMDDSFASMIRAISWGRNIIDAVKRFAQLQISFSIAAVIITYVTALVSTEGKSVFTPLQLLWLNLVVNILGARALASDHADPEQTLKRQPEEPHDAFVSIDMWKLILSQSIYQIAVALVLHFAGNTILGYSQTDQYQLTQNEDKLKTFIFSQFVFCQIFNLINARRLDRGLNIFKGLFQNRWLFPVLLIMIAGQALIINFGRAAFQVTRIDGKIWAISVMLGLISLPLGACVRLLPTVPVERFAIRFLGHANPNKPKPTTKSVGLK